MITADMLKAVDTVPADCLYTEFHALNAFNIAIVQANGGWGVRPADGAVLMLAKHLRQALLTSEKVDETQRAIKGLQLENGRLRAQIAKLKKDDSDVE